MITLTFGGEEYYDESIEEFVETDTYDLDFENSLYAISLWESKWKESYFEKQKLSEDQLLHYFECMCLNGKVNWEDVTPEHIVQLSEYIQDSQTATKIYSTREESSSGKKNTTTSELIYAYMANAQIPFETDKWNINRLTTLINVIGVLNNPEGNKMSQAETMKSNRELNELRKQKYNTKG